MTIVAQAAQVAMLAFLLCGALPSGALAASPDSLAAPAQLADESRDAADDAYNTAQAYAFGLGVPRSLGTALQWYERAALRGHVLSMINLGVLHYHGMGTERDRSLAYAWFRLASAFGSTLALYNLATVEAVIEGPERDAAVVFADRTLPDILSRMTPAEIETARERTTAMLNDPRARRTVAKLNTIRRYREELERARNARGPLPTLTPIE